jgi:hypothetical protein
MTALSSLLPPFIHGHYLRDVSRPAHKDQFHLIATEPRTDEVITYLLLQIQFHLRLCRTRAMSRPGMITSHRSPKRRVGKQKSVRKQSSVYEPEDLMSWNIIDMESTRPLPRRTIIVLAMVQKGCYDNPLPARDQLVTWSCNRTPQCETGANFL